MTGPNDADNSTAGSHDAEETTSRSAQTAAEPDPLHGFDLIKTPTGELWQGSTGEEVAAKALTATIEPVAEDQLRRWSLVGIGGAVLITLAVTTIGLATRWFTEDFAKLVLQTLIPPLLSAFAVVVGYLFAERKRR